MQQPQITCICNQAIIPLRHEPSETSEMETQILFGELYIVLEDDGNWAKVHLRNDGYEGWINSKIVTPIDSELIMQLAEQPFYTVGEKIDFVTVDNQYKMPIGAGSVLYGDGFKLGKHTYSYPMGNNLPRTAESVVELAKQFLGSPYLWGGKSMFGIDCTGLTQVCYAAIGINLPRNASQQESVGQHIPFIADAQPADLAFFGHEGDDRTTHAGILISQNEIIHASSGVVRIDKVDHYGIFNVDTEQYSHTLRAIMRQL